MFAPIVLFTYSRADHTKRVVESLLTNNEAKDSELFIFSDGPKNEDKKEAVEENRRYIHSVSGFKSIHIIERKENWGLANSLIAGITDVIGKYGKVIVVEDDLVVSPYFLKFINEGLEKYKDDERVGTITGFVPPIDGELPENFFLYYFQCWGWATWERAWKLLNKDSKSLLRQLRFKKKKFDVGGGVGNYGNLYCQKVGLVDSWYLRYYASLFLKGKLSLYPGCSLTANEGLDGTGIHCGSDINGTYNVNVSRNPIECVDIVIQENIEVYKKFVSYFMSKQPEPSLKTYFRDIKSFIRRLLYFDCM